MEDWRVAPLKPPTPPPGPPALGNAGFEANPGLMAVQAQAIEGASADLAAGLRAVSLLPGGSADIFGTDEAAGACRGFIDHWVGETSLQTDALLEVAGALRQCAENYCIVDGQVQHQLSRHAG